MTIALGIHCGHESSCAVVRDGQVLAAVQQERVTGRKYDGQEFLSTRLPIAETLDAAGVDLVEVDVIVSSFQAVGPSAIGLQRPLVSPGFDAFDPLDDRHHVVSHHLAHAASAYYLSGRSRATVLISDSAGTTSRDGQDYYLPFKSFVDRYQDDSPITGVFTEMRSIYTVEDDEFTLRERAYVQPHNQPDVYVQNEATLYDNVARFVFRTEHAHGQLMALAGIEPTRPVRITADDIVTGGATPQLRNGWQPVGPVADPLDHADLAVAVQDAFTTLVVHHAARAVAMTGVPHLCCAGGVFLNLAVNSAIDAQPAIGSLYVPSSPHDAGISVGAALLGCARTRSGPRAVSGPLLHDFLGRAAETVSEYRAAEFGYTPARRSTDHTNLAGRTAELLVGGAIVARFAGRAEFGPRALGNRSLLAHPVTCANARATLNRIKHRQPWRPVAPMVRECDLASFFDGPNRSPFMNHNFTVRREYADQLTEALHADGTARVQTVTEDNNPAIHALLTRVAELGHLPVLINTSFNGPAQPIIDSADEALKFVRHPAIEYLLTEDTLFRTPTPAATELRRPGTVVAAVFGSGEDTRYVLSNQTASLPVERDVFLQLCEHGQATVAAGSPSVVACVQAGLLVEVAAG